MSLFQQVKHHKSICALLLLVVTGFGFASPVAAQSSARFVSKSSSSSQKMTELLESGRQFEENGQWGDALTLYERAKKEFGESSQLTQKLFNARTHYDVLRRVHDASYIRTLKSSSYENASNIYSEVLLKIETHYVNQPEWVALARQGLANLDVALYNDTFQQQFIQDRSEASINRAYKKIHQVAQQFRVGSRLNLFQFADKVAQALRDEVAIPKQVTLFEFVNGAATSLDPYSSFLTGDQYADVMSQIDGNFVGLGIEIRPSKDSLQIMSVIPGGPAATAGLKNGDAILSVDRQLVAEIGGNVAADMLKGPEGSTIRLQIERKQQKLVYQIARKRVDIPSLQNVGIIDAEQGIAYIKLSNFQKTTASDFENALWKLHRDGMRSLIVDVRGNPGGLLTAAVDVADLFVSKGVLVSTKGRNPRENYVHRARMEGTWEALPLTVLVDRDSASASEIFAGAINDLSRGTIIGEKSYGKGSVQGIFPLNIARGGIRLTTAKFYSPSGKAISDHGVSPDVRVQRTLKPSYELISNSNQNDENDAVLNSAISIAKKKLVRTAG